MPDKYVQLYRGPAHTLIVVDDTMHYIRVYIIHKKGVRKRCCRLLYKSSLNSSREASTPTESWFLVTTLSTVRTVFLMSKLLWQKMDVFSCSGQNWIARRWSCQRLLSCSTLSKDWSFQTAQSSEPESRINASLRMSLERPPSTSVSVPECSSTMPWFMETGRRLLHSRLRELSLQLL